jgi:hypothetical protein
MGATRTLLTATKISREIVAGVYIVVIVKKLVMVLSRIVQELLHTKLVDVVILMVISDLTVQ